MKAYWPCFIPEWRLCRLLPVPFYFSTTFQPRDAAAFQGDSRSTQKPCACTSKLFLPPLSFFPRITSIPNSAIMDLILLAFKFHINEIIQFILKKGKKQPQTSKNWSDTTSSPWWLETDFLCSPLKYDGLHLGINDLTEPQHNTGVLFNHDELRKDKTTL